MPAAFSRLISQINWFSTSALFALLAGGYQLIYPEPAKRSLVIGFCLWGLASLWLLITACQNKKLWRFPGSVTARVALVLFSVSLFLGFGRTKYNERPPIIYPWLSASYYRTNTGTNARLHILVRDYSSDPNSNIMSLSSLYNLSVSITTPLPFMPRPEGLYYSVCPVAQLDGVNEWSNQDNSHQAVGSINLREGFTLLLISASSRNASWQGFLALHKNGKDIGWEGALSGWAQVNGAAHPMVVRETSKDNEKRVAFGGDFFEVTPEFLLHYGIPMGEVLWMDFQRCTELWGK